MHIDIVLGSLQSVACGQLPTVQTSICASWHFIFLLAKYPEKLETDFDEFLEKWDKD